MSDRIRKTNDLQKTAILKALFGIYVDERNDEYIRQNCLDVSRENWSHFSERAQSELTILYSEYLLQDNTKKQYSKNYFEKVGALAILPKDEQVSIVGKIIKQLESAHFGIDNFYNERPFAERLKDLRNQIPIQIIKEYVYVISLGYVGNSYGTSRTAEPHYIEIIENYSIREIDKLFELVYEDNYLRYSIKNYRRCKVKFSALLNLLNEESVPSKWKEKYQKWK